MIDVYQACCCGSNLGRHTKGPPGNRSGRAFCVDCGAMEPPFKRNKSVIKNLTDRKNRAISEILSPVKPYKSRGRF